MTFSLPKHIFRTCICCLLACTLSVPLRPAYAANSEDLQDQLNEAIAHYDELASQVNDASSALQELEAQLADVLGSIEDLQEEMALSEEELGVKRAALSEIVAESYKHHTSLVALLLGSSSFDELVSNVYYANKVSEQQQEAITEVRTLQQELEEKGSELESLQSELEAAYDEQASNLESFQAAQADQRNYVDSLASELQEALLAEVAAREAEEAARAARDQEEEHSSNENSSGANDPASDSSSDSSSSSAPTAPATAGDDLYVGVFYTSDYDMTDTVYASTDGNTFYRVATAYQQTISGGQYEPGHWCHSCPSIMYHNGYFWMISGWNRNNGKFWPEISYSRDLVNWSDPLGSGFIGTNGVSLQTLPSSGGAGFDTVAPEWFVDTDGTVYIIVSCGYYGAFHGQATHDSMQTYLIRVSELSTSGTPVRYGTPAAIHFSAAPAVKLNVNSDGADRIDGAIYKEGGTYYLIVKRDGLTNEIWKTNNINANNWSLVNNNVTYGYEGPSMIRVGNTYHMYIDHVVGATANGVYQATSQSVGGPWTISNVTFQTFGGQRLSARHGTVIRINRSSQPEAWNTVSTLLNSAH